MSAPYKMKGHTLPGPNQRKSPVPMAAALIGMVKDKKDKIAGGLTKAFDSVGKTQEEEEKKSDFKFSE
jgi:hypothetical protein|tara:strand:+ start:2219 stop:2422 length:204 start_codon:yes stop_codon:yes gene_type:complete